MESIDSEFYENNSYLIIDLFSPSLCNPEATYLEFDQWKYYDFVG